MLDKKISQQDFDNQFICFNENNFTLGDIQNFYKKVLDNSRNKDLEMNQELLSKVKLYGERYDEFTRDVWNLKRPCVNHFIPNYYNKLYSDVDVVEFRIFYEAIIYLDISLQEKIILAFQILKFINEEKNYNKFVASFGTAELQKHTTQQTNSGNDFYINSYSQQTELLCHTILYQGGDIKLKNKFYKNIILPLTLIMRNEFFAKQATSTLLKINDLQVSVNCRVFNNTITILEQHCPENNIYNVKIGDDDILLIKSIVDKESKVKVHSINYNVNSISLPKTIFIKFSKSNNNNMSSINNYNFHGNTTQLNVNSHDINQNIEFNLEQAYTDNPELELKIANLQKAIQDKNTFEVNEGLKYLFDKGVNICVGVTGALIAGKLSGKI